MSLVNSMSPITVLSPFELFTNAPIQTSILHTRVDEVRTNSPLNTGGYLEFDINSSSNEYIKLDEIYLHVKFHVILSKFDKTTVTLQDWDKVSLINNVLHSLWNQVDLSINDIQTTISLLTYSQKAYFNNILTTTPQARTTILELSGFFVDDEKTHYNGVSSKRRRLIEHTKQTEYRDKKEAQAGKTNPETVPVPTATDAEKGKECQLSGKPVLDFFNQYKYLIGNTKLRLKFVLNKPEYIFLINDTNIAARIEFTDVFLEVPKCIVCDELLIAHNEAIKIAPAKYPITRFEVRSQTVDKGVTGKNIENVINGQLPKKIYVALVENEAYNGAYSKNPFLYKHFNISSITCFINGTRLDYHPNFDQRLTNREYLGLCKTCNQTEENIRMPITKRNFELGYTIFAFNIGQDYSEGYSQTGYVNPPVEGSIRFEVQFRTPTPSTLNIIFFCDYDNLISISSERNPIVDF